MERFFTVKKNSGFANKYWEHIASKNKIIELFNQFADEYGIKAAKFRPSEKYLWIVPEHEDKEKFGDVMVKKNLGLFKKNSAMNKAWIQKCKDNGFVYIDLPFIANVLNLKDIFGLLSHRLFDIDNEIYYTVEYNGDYETPEDFLELSPVEFYKIMEEHNITL